MVLSPLPNPETARPVGRQVSLCSTESIQKLAECVPAEVIPSTHRGDKEPTGWGSDLNLNGYSVERAGWTPVPKEEAAEGADMGDVWERPVGVSSFLAR